MKTHNFPIGKRRKRDSTSGGISKTAGNVFVRKGAVIGVYFMTDETAMPIIGNATVGTHSVCKYQGDIDSSTPINCTSSLIQTDIIIHAKRWIGKNNQIWSAVVPEILSAFFHM